MNLIDLFWIALFVGGGAVIGRPLAPGYLGSILGALIGYCTLTTWANLNARHARLSPRCNCGKKEWTHFNGKSDSIFGHVYESRCGLRFVMRKGCLWFIVDESNNATLTQIKPVYRNWREPTEKEIANHRMHGSGGGQRTMNSRSTPVPRDV